ncbi:MAG TPA: fumarylacetoacetate hydrolase family protein [Aquabacterium sp.]|uniref:2-keto-4-pentenoate hydratase n=1 Tax=Aquabacterium sp. TaxID=1872578 RepID=UPI002E33FF62|nr:fumarylacetoacetate hydrolase family protein [Aquabacterium sp.]HEX5357313.1 fumarylacetoacetate hydrolase family protein [Aquabacterium sp.]
MNNITTHSQAAAAILAERRLKGLQGPCLPDGIRPASLQEAMAIQQAVTALMGDAVGGWKCGTPGPDKLVVAPIYASTIHRQTAAAPCPVWANEGSVRVEPELAFVLGRDLPVRAQPYAPDEVDEAIAATHLALELIDSRYNDPTVLSFADKLADGLVNQGLFIGPEVDGEVAGSTHVMPIAVRVDGGPEQVRAGQHPDPLPRLPLYWLVAYLREQGVGLRAGQVVITGSYAGTFPLPIGPEVSLRYGELGELRARFQARPRA